ncbi:hypothetical protein CLF_111439 [Clonorchis sinensis]|uniref:MD-2-related lipid-recognition domain-containing protein n=1 Tax=Clonorchis sinensis TaxID=79923 RepID=G7YUW1_CLOSI|nr:hypothetical protein CLF_111439 [Clonorchis sinensis]
MCEHPFYTGSTIAVKASSIERRTAKLCELVRGRETTFRIGFQAGSPNHTEGYGVFKGIAAPLELGKPEICGNVHSNCPLQPGTTYIFVKTVQHPNTSGSSFLILRSTMSTPAEN